MTVENTLYSENAEMNVIGGLLIAPELIYTVMGLGLKPRDFFMVKYEDAYSAMCLCAERKQTIDVSIIVELMNQHGRAKGNYDMGFLIQATAESSFTNTTFFAETVKRYGVRRSLLEATRTIQQMVMETDSLSTEEIASKALRVVNDASLRMARGDGQWLSEACDEFISEFKARIKGTGLSGYPTGLTDLDATIGGYEEGRLYIVAGRTGMGKTSWLVYSMLKLAMANPDKPIVFYTTEMSKSELIQRMASIVSGVPVMALKTPHRLSREQLQSVSSAMTTLKGVNIWLEDLSAPTPNDVRVTLESLKNRYGAYICFIDGLYRMKTGDKQTDRDLHQRFGTCAQELKSISRDLMPVVATHQLNRDAQNKGDAGTLPSLSNLRESGKIEEEADVVVMLHRPKYYDRMLVEDIAQILVAKNRSGATGVINSYYDAPTMNFSPCHTTNVDLSDL